MASTAVSTDVKSMNPHQLVHHRMPEIAKALPRQVPSEKFQRVFDLAVMRDPTILRCEPRTVLEAVQKCATDGLVLDGREAALVVYNRRQKDGNQWVTVKTAQYIPMIGGILKRARNSGEIASIHATPVFAKEIEQGLFELEMGTNPFVKHTPLLTGNRGDLALVYSVCKLRDGTVSIDYMTVEEINAIRARSRSKDKDGNITGPWATDYLEMAKKTVLRRHSKVLPMDSDLSRIFQRLDDHYDLGRDQIESKRPDGAAKRLSVALERQAGSEVDEETGEVTKPASDEPTPGSSLSKIKKKAAPKEQPIDPPAPDDIEDADFNETGDDDPIPL